MLAVTTCNPQHTWPVQMHAHPGPERSVPPVISNGLAGNCSGATGFGTEPSKSPVENSEFL